MSFVPGTHFYRQQTKYTKPAAKPVPATTKIKNLCKKEKEKKGKQAEKNRKHPLSPVIRLGLQHQRKKERNGTISVRVRANINSVT